MLHGHLFLLCPLIAHDLNPVTVPCLPRLSWTALAHRSKRANLKGSSAVLESFVSLQLSSQTSVKTLQCRARPQRRTHSQQWQGSSGSVHFEMAEVPHIGQRNSSRPGQCCPAQYWPSGTQRECWSWWSWWGLSAALLLFKNSLAWKRQLNFFAEKQINQQKVI